MKTRRVRRAMNKIAHTLIQDGVKEDSHLWKTWTAFVNAFISEYRKQWVGKDIKKPRMHFKGIKRRKRK